MQIPAQLIALNNDRLKIAATAAAAGAQAVLETVPKGLTATRKSVADFASEADHRAEDAILASLKASGIASGDIVSEERDGAVERIENGWLVDPLDGSSSVIFDCGKHYPTTIVIEIVDGRPELAIMLFPFTGEWFYAVRGQGAYRNEERLILDSPVTELGDAWVVMNRFGDAADASAAMNRLEPRLRSSAGAGLLTCEVAQSGMACRVAEGRLGAFIHDNNAVHVKQCPWDMAPQLLIVSEAGGACRTLDGNEPDAFDPKPYLVAQSNALIDQILALLA